MLVRFEKGTDLEKYGFDLRADRVVRFDKRPSGTYMNTRATYTFDDKNFTHLYLRTKAIEIQTKTVEASSSSGLSKKNKIVKWIGIVAVLALIASLTECTANFNIEVNNVENAN